MSARSPGALRIDRRAIATLAVLAWATHVLVMRLRWGASADEALWACHVAPLVLALGCALDSLVVTSIAVTWIVLGTPLWIGALLAVGHLPDPTPALIHLGSLALGLGTVRTMGWDRHAWWRASLAIAALAAVTRLVPGAERHDVNLVFRPWPGLEPVFPELPSFLGFLALVVPLSFWIIGRAMQSIAATGARADLRPA